ncbi:NAD(P)H-binding protein [Actinoallomurus purpureus]|uniref:SDR family oxidoreductase n=1 Tax=Actinoallomurus purpureus TaxID=478114 RepID=UPI00209375DE|nr:NAD(P)H-binding protein [Actinoallomurus purpureus]MCO6007242.1 NAD(P)H-binding protein [Actinoallomurus purpureus]
MIVITGATGNVGARLVSILAATGEQVTAVSRRAPATDLPEGVRHVPADLDDPASLKPALDGADALFLLVAGQDPQGILDAARAGGVRRIVLLSSQGAGTRPESYRHPRAFEDAVRESGLEWTVLRPGGFDSNAFAWAEMVRSKRMVAAPFGDVGLPTVDPDDIAEVAAVVLVKDEHAGRTYELTGPEPTNPRERTQVIGDALGTPVTFVEQTRAEARAQMLQFMPEPVVEGTLSILGEPMPAEQRVSPDIEHLLGRPPHSFADWAARNIAAFR